jgi:hypothetical protein
MITLFLCAAAFAACSSTPSADDVGTGTPGGRDSGASTSRPDDDDDDDAPPAKPTPTPRDAGNTVNPPDAGPRDASADVVTDAPPPPPPPPPFKVLGTITTTVEPSFLFLEPMPAATDPASLVITSFMPTGLTTDTALAYVPKIGEKLGALGSTRETVITNRIQWPNEAVVPPAGIFPSHGLVVTTGFLLIGNTTGSVSFVAPNGTISKLTADRNDYFYHHVEFIDMNGDGRLDMLTMRANKPLLPFQPTAGELVWLEQPATNPLGVWKEHVLLSGNTAPDVNFRLRDLDGDGEPEILAAQFFSKRLVVYWFEGAKVAANLKSKVIDAHIGSAFDVEFDDLNHDGNVDLLVTNHEVPADEAKAGVFAYEIPTNWKTDAWPKHALATGFRAIAPSPFVNNPMAPGAPKAFHPNVAETDKKPLIVVSGDDYQKVTLLVPKSEEATDWGYHRYTVVDTQKTSGGMALGDVDGDGWVELFCPGHGTKKIHVVTFKP